MSSCFNKSGRWEFADLGGARGLASTVILLIVFALFPVFECQVFAQLDWHHSIEQAKFKVADFDKRLVIVAQFRTSYLGDLFQSQEFTSYNKKIASHAKLNDWLKTKVVLVAESAKLSKMPKSEKGKTSEDTSDQQAASNTFFCLPDGRAVYFVVGDPTGEQLLNAAIEAAKIASEIKDSADINGAIREVHQSKLVETDIQALESALPTNVRTTYRVAHVVEAVNRIQRDNLLKRFGESLSAKEAGLLVKAIGKQVPFGSEVINMTFSRLQNFDLRKIDHAVWSLSIAPVVDTTAKQNRQKLFDFVFAAKSLTSPIVLRVTESNKCAKGEFSDWPSQKERTLTRLTRGFKTATCNLEDLAQVTELLGASPVVLPPGKQIRLFLATYDGSETEVVYSNDKRELRRAINIIKKANP